MNAAAAEYITGIHRRRNASRRIEGGDPWRYDDPDEITEQYVDGYRDAAEHLLNQGLAPAPNLRALRVMWRRGGEDQRLAIRVAEMWEVAA